MSAGKHAAPSAIALTSVVPALAASAIVVPSAVAGSAVTAPVAHADTVIPDAGITQDIPHLRPLITRIVSAAARKSYTIVSGDTLTGIAGRACASVRKWPGIWSQNKAEIKNPDLIRPGQKLTFTCEQVTAALTRAAMAAIPQVVPVQVMAQVSQTTAERVASSSDGDGDHDHDSGDGAAVRATVTGASGTISVGGGWPGGAFGACVVARESGGRSQVMNSSGHYGLYQFSESTWIAYGGSAADFGHASVAEQERVFMNALARGGQSNWSPYDGC